MRNQWYVFVCVWLLLACESPEQPKGLPGTWKLDQYVAKTQGVNQQLIDEARSISLSTTYLFHPDQTLDVYVDFLSDSSTGVWEYDTANQNLYIRYANNLELNLRVLYMDGDTLIWEQPVYNLGSTKSRLVRTADYPTPTN